MKTNYFLIIAAIIATASFFGCSKSNNEAFTPEQQAILGKMKVAFSNAKTFDDSLINCSTSANSDKLLINHFDSCYHINDSAFTHCHSYMMNTNNGMMGSNGGMMGNDHSMCTTQNDEFNQVMMQMSQLRENHTKHHPK